MKNLSLHHLFNTLISRADINKIDLIEEVDDSKVATTIRTEAKLRSFLNAQSDNLGVSIQDFITMTLRAVMESTLPHPHIELDLCSHRFLDLFKIHKIPLVNLPLFFEKKTFLRSDLKDHKTLLNKLSDEVLKKTANYFSVDKEWIQGISDFPAIKQKNRWYKNDSLIIEKIVTNRLEGRPVKIHLIFREDTNNQLLKEAREKNSNSEELNIMIGIQVENTVSEVPYTYYELFLPDRWNYSGTRNYLKAFLMLCKKADIHFSQTVFTKEIIKKLECGDILLAEAINKYSKMSKVDFRDFLEDESWNPEREELVEVKSVYKRYNLERYVSPMLEFHKFKTIYDFNNATSCLLNKGA